ncbi:MAG: alpha/beta hydrolase [Dysgonamonadaceae bacterium]|jgi:acetyl esterase/lipase|nr:alpha/beta hydrolase [Dysgonamonadaceae bacterium]
MIKIIFIALISNMFSVWAFSSEPVKPINERLSKGLPKVIVIGDEMVNGLIPSFREKLVEDFQVEYAMTANSTQLLQRISQTQNHYDVILFNIGQQELKQQNPGKIEEILHELISIAEKRKIELLWFNGSVVTNIIVLDSLETTLLCKLTNNEKVTTIDFRSFVNDLRLSLKGRPDKDSIVLIKAGEYLAESLMQWWAACAKNNPNVMRIKLWKDLPPVYEYSGEERINSWARIDHVSVPELEWFLPQKRKASTAVIFFPGGGYRYLGFLRNAKDLAHMLNSAGIAVFGLKYRTGRLPEVPLMDAIRAVRFVRAHAEEWGINPNCIGVIGQSAGANLVLRLAGNYTEGNPISDDPIENESSRPDFMGVLTSWNFGSNTSSFSFRSDMPPLFLRHAKDDSGYPLALEILRQIENRNVSKDVLILDKGGHGAFELSPSNPGFGWPGDFVRWLRTIGLLKQ